MARCGACGKRKNIQNPDTYPVVIGNANALIQRVWVAGHGGPEHPPLLQVGQAYYVAGDGVQALLDSGVLTLA